MKALAAIVAVVWAVRLALFAHSRRLMFAAVNEALGRGRVRG